MPLAYVIYSMKDLHVNYDALLIVKLLYRYTLMSRDIRTSVKDEVIGWQIVNIMKHITHVLSSLICYLEPYVEQHATIETILMILKQIQIVYLSTINFPIIC